jgi:hypothetical protein
MSDECERCEELREQYEDALRSIKAERTPVTIAMCRYVIQELRKHLLVCEAGVEETI